MLIPSRLNNKIALVTGASRGIGGAVALAFAGEGASVAISHLGDPSGAAHILAELARASASNGHRAAQHFAYESDAGDTEAIKILVANTITRFGRLDILVNNAGIQMPTPGDAVDEADMARILAVNLTGPACFASAAISHFLSRPGGGCIINTSSVHESVPKPGFLAYSIAKGGIGNLTRTLALEFADRGIRVNAVAPGAVITDMNAAWTLNESARKSVESHIPMGRAATVADIAPVFTFLASAEAGYITGQTIYACGGLTLYGDFKHNWAS